MKMGAGLFWGIILIAIGLSIILNIVFDVSVSRVIIAIIIIMIGIRILVGKPFLHHTMDQNHAVFSEKTYNTAPVNNSEYNTIFGKTVYDFRQIDTISERITKISFNTIFGNTSILLPPHIPVKIKADGIFSSVKLPNGNTIAFGSTKYSSENADSSASQIYIVANVIFGGLDIQQ